MGFYRSDGFDVKTLLDISGSVYGITVSNGSANSMVYFAYNAQGDVIGLYGYNGTLYATYDYDAWGNCTVTPLVADTAGHSITDANHIAHINPFRYRGYYYDTETGLYYLGSRYYDPVVGRFINADMVMGVNQDMASYNLFAYCGNNPVNRADSSGLLWWDVVVAAVAVAAVCVAVVVAAPVLAPVVGVAAGSLVAGAAATATVAGVTAITASVIAAVEEPIVPNTKSSERDRAEERVIPKPPRINETKIYRSATGTARSLTPRPGIDYDGLSFYLTPPIGEKYYETTIEKVNATGFLEAVIDRPGHCSVRPRFGSIEGWMSYRDKPVPHFYTLLLLAVLDGPYRLKR